MYTSLKIRVIFHNTCILNFCKIQSNHACFYLLIQVIKIEKIDAAIGEEFTFKKVLLVNGNQSSSALVKAKILSHCKTDKVLVFKKKRRHNYRRKNGHRQIVHWQYYY